MKFEMIEDAFETETTFGQLTISGNDEYGFRPYQLLISSIAVCSGGVLRNILDKMRMPAEHISIKGEAIDASKMDRVFELTKKNCSMVQSVIDSIEVVETYEVLN